MEKVSDGKFEENQIFPEEEEIIIGQIIEVFKGHGKRLSLKQIHDVLESTKDAFYRLPLSVFSDS